MSNELVEVDDAQVQILSGSDIPSMNPAAYRQMEMLASNMARSSVLPESLTMTGDVNSRTKLPIETIEANCFRIVNQAVRWRLDPFAVADSCSIVRGKLCLEGKLVAAVLQATAGIKLYYYHSGPVRNDARAIHVVDRELTAEEVDGLSPGTFPYGVRGIYGTVDDWKTKGDNTPWQPKNFDRQLVYRGSREWARMFEAASLMGVYTPDEFDQRAERATNITPVKASSRELLENKATSGTEGFNRDQIDKELDAEIIENTEQTQTDTPADVGEEEAPPTDDASPSGSEADPEQSSEPDPNPEPETKAEEKPAEETTTSKKAALPFAQFLVKFLTNAIADNSVDDEKGCKEQVQTAFDNELCPEGSLHTASEDDLKKAKTFRGWAFDVIDGNKGFSEVQTRMCDVLSVSLSELRGK